MTIKRADRIGKVNRIFLECLQVLLFLKVPQVESTNTLRFSTNPKFILLKSTTRDCHWYIIQS